MLSKKPTELEQAVLDAIKLQLVDTFKKVSISCALEEREVVIRISIPEEIMQVKDIKIRPGEAILYDAGFHFQNKHLDIDAQKAANELLGIE